MQSDDELNNLFKPKKYTETTTEKRVEKVVKNIEFEQHTNDVITFAVGKSFTTLMTILAPLFALIGIYTHNNKEVK